MTDAGDRISQFPRTGPSRRAAEGGATRGGGRLHRGDELRPLLAVERAPGAVRIRLVVPRRRAGDDVAPVRRGERPRPAVPPGDRGAGEIGRATSELQSPCNLVCRLLLEKKKPRYSAAHQT